MGREQGSYYTAQVCLNGHPITGALELVPGTASEHCPKCGEVTTDHCECGSPVRGLYASVVMSRYHPPAYCHACGKPLPWTRRTLEAARELIAEMDDLKPDEREALSKSLDDLRYPARLTRTLSGA